MPVKAQEKVKSSQLESQVVYTRSVSIKGILRGEPRNVPIKDAEIDEIDHVARIEDVLPPAVEITEETIRKAWLNFAGTMEKSHPRWYTTLTQILPELRADGVIQLLLNSEAQRDNFVQNIKPAISKYLKENLANVEYVFEARIADSTDSGKKVYTDQDKLEYLMKKNPALGKLKSSFNLDFDN